MRKTSWLNNIATWALSLALVGAVLLVLNIVRPARIQEMELSVLASSKALPPQAAAAEEMAAQQAVTPAWATEKTFEVTDSPGLVSVEKSVMPEGQVKYGDELTYTLVISAAPGTQVGLYDQLTDTTFTRFVEQPAGVTYADISSGTLRAGIITGTLTFTPTNQITVSFVAQVGVPGTVGYTVSATNRACIYPLSGTLGGCVWSNEVTNAAFRFYAVYLPLVSKPLGLQSANPNASTNAKRLLSYLDGLSSRPDNRVVSGQFTGHGELAPEKYSQFVEQLYTATGKWVAMTGVDYGPWRGSSVRFDLSVTNAPLISHWNAGGLATISWHARNPWTGKSAWNEDSPDWDLGSADLLDLITPGKAVYDAWMDELDYHAAGLAELRDAGVVVLWRPFHEMNYTNLFWWNTLLYGDPEPYKALWRHMFNYFTNEKGLDNLLWVYAAANIDPWVPLDLLYPGNEYVDIVGVDVYHNSTTIRGEGYERLAAIGKPFYLTETGPGTILDGTWDNTTYINKIRNEYPLIVGIFVWSSWPGNKIAIVDNRNAQALLDDPWIITRDELDWESGPVIGDIIIDDTDYRFSTAFSQDAWQEYTLVGGQHYGDSHHYNGQIGTGEDIATWSFIIPEPGKYKVYAWWWETDSRPTDVPYTINYLGGSTTVRVDQRTGGGRWNLLGVFDFQSQGSVIVSDDASSGRDVVADAIRLVYLEPLSSVKSPR